MPVQGAWQVTAAVQTRCAGCGHFVRRRADILDPEFNELARSEEAYSREWEEHDCPAQYSENAAPRRGEYEAYLESLDVDGLVEELGEAGAAAYLGVTAETVDAPETAAAPVAAAAAVEAAVPEVEAVSLSELVRRMDAAAKPPTVRPRRRVTPVSAEDWDAIMGARVVAEAERITRAIPAAWLEPVTPEQLHLLGGDDGEEPSLRARARRDSAGMRPAGGRRDGQKGQRDAGATGRPNRGPQPGSPTPRRADRAARLGRRSDTTPVRPLPWPDTPQGERPTAQPPPGRAGRLPVASVERDRRTAPTRPRRGRRGLRLSRLLRWLQQDDPRLTHRLERTARVVEWVERLFVADPH